MVVFICDNYKRVLYPLRRLTLTNFKVKILRGARNGTLKKAVEAFDLKKKWEGSPLALKAAKRTVRANLNDLDRFKVMINRKKRSFKVRQLAKKIGGGAAKGKAPAAAAKGAKGKKK